MSQPKSDITVSGTAKVTGTVKADLKYAKDSFATTDVPKIYAMRNANGYDAEKFKEGKVKVTQQPEGEQKKITATIGKDKKTITVSAAKGTKAGKTAYFLLVYNTNHTTKRKGFLVFSVETK